jgi:hypothetical protein
MLLILLSTSNFCPGVEQGWSRQTETLMYMIGNYGEVQIFWKKETNQNCIHKEMNSRCSLGNAC